MSGDVERVAMQLMAELEPKMQWPSASEGWRNRYRAAALVAMRETRLIDAETANRLANYAARPMGVDAEYYRKWKSAADWLTTRAGGE